MSTSLKIILHDRVKDGGLQTLQFRITKNGVKKYITTGYSIKKKDWNSEDLRVKNTHPNHEFLNVLIGSKFSDYQQKILILEMENPNCTTEQIMDAILSETGSRSKSFFEFADNDLKRFSGPDNVRQHKGIKSNIDSFRLFAGDDIRIDQVTPTLIKNYISHLRAIPNSNTTIKWKLSRVRALVNAAIREKLLSKDLNPFDGFKMPTPEQSHKIRLTLDEIKRIENVPTQQGTRAHDAKSVFLFQFYQMGMRVGDAILLKWENIKGDRLVYGMTKTGKAKNMKLTEQSLKIIEGYKGLDPEYVFGLIKNREIPHADIDNVNVTLNEHIKQVSRLAKIERWKEVTTHVARHSFAKNADDMGIDRKYIQIMTGHSSARELDIYLDSIQDDIIDREFLKIQEKMK